MRRYRRLVLIDRLIPFLAAFVGLVALAGAMLVQLDGRARDQRVAGEVAAMRASMEQLTQRAGQLGDGADDGTAEGLLALQERIDALEDDWKERFAAAMAAGAGAAPAAAAAASGTTRVIDPSWPTTDCIPLDTRFMAVPNESYPICESPAVVKVSAITADNVALADGGVLTETGIRAIAGTPCTISLLSADAEGFAEMRVSCQ